MSAVNKEVVLGGVVIGHAETIESANDKGFRHEGFSNKKIMYNGIKMKIQMPHANRMLLLPPLQDLLDSLIVHDPLVRCDVYVNTENGWNHPIKYTTPTAMSTMHRMLVRKYGPFIRQITFYRCGHSKLIAHSMLGEKAMK